MEHLSLGSSIWLQTRIGAFLLHFVGLISGAYVRQGLFEVSDFNKNLEFFCNLQRHRKFGEAAPLKDQSRRQLESVNTLASPNNFNGSSKSSHTLGHLANMESYL